MGCCSCMSKVFLVVFNVVFFLAGCVPLVFGSIALANEALLKDILDAIPGFKELTDIVDVQEFFQNFAVAFIILGSIVVVIGFAGCCGAIFNSKCLLGVYLTVVILIILAEVAVIIIAAFFPDTFSAAGEALMKTNFKDIQDCNITLTTEKCGGTTSTAWNAMQLELKCCGYSGISDYEDKSAWSPRFSDVDLLAPATCCKGLSGNIDDPDYGNTQFRTCYFDGKNFTQYYQEGCFDVLIDEALSSAIVIGVLAGIGALEIILVIATIIAVCEKSKGTAA